MKSSEAVRMTIEADIESGALSVGDTIDEKKLAQQFDVSKTPVREAILQLVASGLVHLVPRHGAVVSGPTPQLAIGMVETLTALEAEAASLAARRMTPAERDQLQSVHDQCKGAVDSLDSETYIAMNTTFHERVYTAARNDFLAEQIRFTRKRMRFYHRSSLFQPTRLIASWKEHGEVVDAILQGDERLAQDTMRAHILYGGRVFADLVSALGSNIK